MQSHTSIHSMRIDSQTHTLT